MRDLAATIIFGLSYVLIASRRVRMLPIGRPGGALLGAVAMVAVGVLTPKESYAAVDHDTIVLLFAMMVLSVYLEESGFFLRLGAWLARRAKTPWRMLAALSVLSAGLSALLLNDTVCVFLTPLVVAVCARSKLPMGPFLIALATSANIGSAATLVGNPQNMLIGSMSNLSFVRFFALAALPTAAALAINVALLAFYFKRALPASLDQRAFIGPADRVPTAFIQGLAQKTPFPLALAVLIGLAIGFVAGLHLAYTALTGVLILILVQRRDPRAEFSRIDWPLLVFFSCLFILVAGFAKTGLPERAWDASRHLIAPVDAQGVALFSVLMAIGSNLVSNVPLVLLAGPHFMADHTAAFGWVLMGFVTTVAGNLTLLGSVANLIVAESAREHYALGFREYLRFGFVSTVVVLATCVPLLVLVDRVLLKLFGWT